MHIIRNWKAVNKTKAQVKKEIKDVSITVVFIVDPMPRPALPTIDVFFKCLSKYI